MENVTLLSQATDLINEAKTNWFFKDKINFNQRKIEILTDLSNVAQEQQSETWVNTKITLIIIAAFKVTTLVPDGATEVEHNILLDQLELGIETL